MRVFIEVSGLFELEQAEKWGEAKDLLMNLWHNDPQNIGKLCRALAECWYVLVEWEHSLNTDNLSYDSFQLALIETTQYGLEHCTDDANFLWMAGYMIELFPHLFYIHENADDSSEYLRWEQMGIEMIRQSTVKAPDNLIAEIFYHGTKSTFKNYSAVRKKLVPMLCNIIWGDTAVEVYFKEILSL